MILRFFALICIFASLAAVRTTQADPPPVLVLSHPQAAHSRTMRLQAQAYPYGYFGARGSTHWQRQFGLYRNYTQWSQR